MKNVTSREQMKSCWNNTNEYLLSGVRFPKNCPTPPQRLTGRRANWFCFCIILTARPQLRAFRISTVFVLGTKQHDEVPQHHHHDLAKQVLLLSSAQTTFSSEKKHVFTFAWLQISKGKTWTVNKLWDLLMRQEHLVWQEFSATIGWRLVACPFKQLLVLYAE